MIDLFTSCGDVASVGIIVDFSNKMEKYIIQSTGCKKILLGAIFTVCFYFIKQT